MHITLNEYKPEGLLLINIIEQIRAKLGKNK